MSLISDTLKHWKLGESVSFQNLSISPLTNGSAPDAAYLTLDEALSRGCVHVTEISEGGHVPELKVVNDGEMPVLLLDGEELVGAKQNRILNLTILVAARSTLVVPVSCVEAGRWSHISEEFAAAPQAQFAEGRARKAADVSRSMSRTGERKSDQGGVWSGISAKVHRMAVHSDTGAMADIFKTHAHRIEDYVTAFPAADHQAGAVFSIQGRVAGMDLFDCPGTFHKLYPKLLRSYAMDALDASAWPAVQVEDGGLEKFLHRITAARVERFKAVGEGHDLRFHAPSVTGGALEHEDRILHLCAFQLVATGSKNEGNGKMSSPSVRRRHRV